MELFRITVTVYGEINKDGETDAPTVSPVPTLSPAPTVDPLPQQTDLLVLVARPALTQLANKSADFAKLFWQKVGSEATAKIGSQILDSSPNATLGDILAESNNDTVEAVVLLGQQLLEESMEQGRGSRRFLEEDFEEYITPEWWM